MILDYWKKASAIEPKDGQCRRKVTTAGWELKIGYHDSSIAWVPLKTLKVMNPVEFTKCAVANKIDEKVAFAWWVPQVMQKCDQIIKKVKL